MTTADEVIAETARQSAVIDRQDRNNVISTIIADVNTI